MRSLTSKELLTSSKVTRCVWPWWQWPSPWFCFCPSPWLSDCSWEELTSIDWHSSNETSKLVSSVWVKSFTINISKNKQIKRINQSYINYLLKTRWLKSFQQPLFTIFSYSNDSKKSIDLISYWVKLLAWIIRNYEEHPVISEAALAFICKKSPAFISNFSSHTQRGPYFVVKFFA